MPHDSTALRRPATGFALHGQEPRLLRFRTRPERHLGLLGATGVGVGAIVGGGILALAGAAFVSTGPSAVVAFGLNGLLALITALSFAEMSCAFPESGGTYTFAKKVLSVEAAFAVGWVVWFASVLAAVLYALGFGAFALVAIEPLWRWAVGPLPPWLAEPMAVPVLAVAATVFYSLGLLRTSGGGGNWENIGKLAVFAVLIAAGLWTAANRPVAEMGESLQPFFTRGLQGLLQAMGFSFIALQGFDLISAVAGEIKDPVKNIPRAMLYSLGTALAIYLPLLVLISVAGVPLGEDIDQTARQDPETIVATAAQFFLGGFGYWLVVAAALLSMLSALRANLFAASRMAFAMARDRTVPRVLSIRHRRLGTPMPAILTTGAAVLLMLLLISDVAAAGAASSLIFLISFAVAHWLSVLIRLRGGNLVAGFRVPLFPLVPAVGATACLALAVFQGTSVPTAGRIVTIWLCLGGILYLLLFARRARIADASELALHPEMARLRGQTPLVLVPIANPASAGAMIAVANAMAPPRIGQVLLLSVIVPPETAQPERREQLLDRAQGPLRRALAISLENGVFPEALTTIANNQWAEINRVAREHRCESLLLGFSDLSEEVAVTPLDELLGNVNCDVVVLRARPGWSLPRVRRILIPVAGRGGNARLRARLLGSLARTGDRHITYLQVLSPRASAKQCTRARRDLARLVRDEAPGRACVRVVQAADIAQALTDQAKAADLVILGVQRASRRKRALGKLAVQIARNTECGILLIGDSG
jgi:amino acid transporter